MSFPFRTQLNLANCICSKPLIFSNSKKIFKFKVFMEVNMEIQGAVIGLVMARYPAVL